MVAATGDVGEICKRIEDPDRMFRMAATDLFVEKAQYILTPDKKDVARLAQVRPAVAMSLVLGLAG